MESDDDELQRAIQLSLGEDNGNSTLPPQSVIDLTEEDDVWAGFDNLDDIELWKGIAMSMGKGKSPVLIILTIEPTLDNCRKLKSDGQGETEPKIERQNPPESDFAQSKRNLGYESGSDTASEEDEISPPKIDVKPVPTKPAGLAGLDRAAMERERLTRARKAGYQGDSPEPPSKRQKTNHVMESISSTSVNFSSTGLQYPNGTIKWTYAKGYPRENHTITIEEVLRKDTLKAAVLSAFQVLFASDEVDASSTFRGFSRNSIYRKQP